jgi:hypothetical protein
MPAYLEATGPRHRALFGSCQVKLRRVVSAGWAG